MSTTGNISPEQITHLLDNIGYLDIVEDDMAREGTSGFPETTAGEWIYTQTGMVTGTTLPAAIEGSTIEVNHSVFIGDTEFYKILSTLEYMTQMLVTWEGQEVSIHSKRGISWETDLS